MKKRLLCSFLAVMMLISMLAGIVLPASAEEVSMPPRYSEAKAQGLSAYSISSKEDWIQLTEDFEGVNCSLELYVTNDIDFENTNMKPLSYGTSRLFHGKLYGQGHTFKNIKIEMEGGTNQYQGVSLVGALGAGTIQDLGITGNIYNTSTSTSARTAVFSGGAAAGNNALIKNCWSDVHVKGPSTNRSLYLSVFYAVPALNQKVENCINYGTVESTSTNGGVSVFFPYGAQATVKNSIDLGTLVSNGSGVGGSVTSHHNGLQNIVFSNSYAVGHNYWGKTHTFDASGVNAAATINGQAITSADQVDALMNAASAGEAAWKATDGADGEVYYKLDDTKGVVFGTATDRVQKITFSGLVDGATYYLNNGKTLDLAQVLADAEVTENVVYGITEGYESAIAGNTLTVPNADVNIQVSKDDPTAAKADLQALYDGMKDYNPAYFNEGDALAAWQTDALAALNAESITTAEVVAVTGAGNALTLTIKENTYIPYSENKLYSALNTTNTWGITVKEDWIKLTEDFEGKSCDLTLYVTNDIDFESTNMKPLAYGASCLFDGKLYGQGYTFKNIKIEMEGGTDQYQGVSLIGALGAGTIQDLGLTGAITNTSTAANGASTAAFSAGACAGRAATIKNCWSSVTVKGPSDVRGRWLSVFFARPAASQVIENCINYGTVQTTSEGDAGASVFYGYSANPTIKNCLDLGTFVGSGAGVLGAVNSHNNGLHTFINANSYSITNFWGKTHGFAAGSATMPDGSPITDEAQVDAVFNAETAAEAAWKATNGAKGEVYYKLDADKGVTYGTATDRVWRVSLVNGSVVTNYYGMEGLTVELPEAAAGKVRVVSGAVVEGNTLTVGQSDATVSYIDYEDSEFYAKKAALQAKIDSYDKYDAKYVGNWAAIEAWIVEAEALIADPYATDDAVVAKTKAAPAITAAALSYPDYPGAADFELYKNVIKNYTINDKADWLALVEYSTTNSLSYNGYSFHVTSDIDFEDTEMLPVGYCKYRFEGTLDGHGYVFKNLNIVATGSGSISGTGNTTGIGLFADKTGGAIKDIALASGTVTSTGKGSYIGSFAGYAKLCPVTNCWSALTIKTCEGYTGKVGGFVGRGSASLAIDGCYYIGSIETDAPAYSVNGMVGYAEANKGLVKNSFVYSEGVDGISGVHTNQYGASATFAEPTINSYNIGGKAFDLGDGTNYDQVFVDHADAIAAFEAKYALTVDAYADGTLAYKLNEGSAASGIYFTVKAGKTVLGSATDKVVKITIDGEVFYAATGARISYAVSGSDVLVVESGDALVNGNIVTAGVEDTVINVGADTDSLLAAAKRSLENLLALYNAREAKYFTSASWTAQNEWKAIAEEALAANTLDAINAAITAEADVSKAAASMTYPNYPSIADYAAYKDTGVKNFAIGSKAEWLAAVAMTTGTVDETYFDINTVLHLTADIDMENETMLPLCYGGYCAANIDGHGYAFSNIHVYVDKPAYPVGLISNTSGRMWARNLGIESGIVEVTGDEQAGTNDEGDPIYKGYKAGGLFGKTGGHYIRNCWNAAQIKVSHRDNVGGIVGDGRGLLNIDNCFNLGKVSGGYGISGYAAATTKIYNCVDLGITYGLVYYHANLFGDSYTEEGLMGKFVFNSWAKTKLFPGMNIDSNVTDDDEKILIDNIRRKLNNEYQVGT
ncbi:MAG: hypothetical protein IJN34_06445, partial [Clostridia bacterium]|nr:hypothetical protein [Clostridia bacterium]